MEEGMFRVKLMLLLNVDCWIVAGVGFLCGEWV